MEETETEKHRKSASRDAVKLQAQAMLSAGEKWDTIIETTGIARSTLFRVKKKMDGEVSGGDVGKVQSVALIKKTMGDNILHGAHKLLAVATDSKKLEKLTAQQAAVAFGILYDKYRLHTGQSTANVAHVISSLVDEDPE